MGAGVGGCDPVRVQNREVVIVVPAIASPDPQPTQAPRKDEAPAQVVEAKAPAPTASGAEVEEEWKALQAALADHKLTVGDLVALESGAGNLEQEIKTTRTREFVLRMQILRQGLVDLMIDKPFLQAKFERTKAKLTAGGGELSPEAKAKLDEVARLIAQENYLKANEVLTGLQTP